MHRELLQVVPADLHENSTHGRELGESTRGSVGPRNITRHQQGASSSQ